MDLMAYSPENDDCCIPLLASVASQVTCTIGSSPDTIRVAGNAVEIGGGGCSQALLQIRVATDKSVEKRGSKGSAQWRSVSR
jgi:hypothetical protein